MEAMALHALQSAPTGSAQFDKARGARIADSSQTISWTGGYSNPGDPGVQREHSRFTFDQTALTRVTEWARASCQPETRNLP
jgi:hypothetical protein